MNIEMSVISRAAEIQKNSGLDVIWIQVGYFFETYGSLAVELSEKLDMVLSSRNGVPKVGFPASHTRRRFEKTIDAGYSVGLAYQEKDGNFRLERNLGLRSSRLNSWDKLPDESFLETGDIKYLGIRGNEPLRANEVFKHLSDLGAGNWRRICTLDNCIHDSEYVECSPPDTEESRKLLGMSAGVIIYPQAW